MTSLSFSSDGKLLLVGCSGGAHYVLDAFEGHLLAKLELPDNNLGLERRRPEERFENQPQRGCSGKVSSTPPDSRFIAGGGLDGRVSIWDAGHGQPRENPDLNTPPLRLQPLPRVDGHLGPARCVRTSPRLAMNWYVRRSYDIRLLLTNVRRLSGSPTRRRARRNSRRNCR